MTATAYAPKIDPSNIFHAANEAFQKTQAWLLDEACELTASAVERMLDEMGKEIMRLLMQTFVTHIGLRRAEGAIVGEDGEERNHERVRERTFRTIFGDIVVERIGYSQRGLTSRFPVDAALNLPPTKTSLEVQRRGAIEVVRGSYDDALGALDRSTNAGIAKRQLQQEVITAAQDFDAFYEGTELNISPEDTSDILVITMDGKGVVMRPEGLREATRKAAEKSAQKMTARLSKGEKSSRKRMAEVAAVYTIAPWVRAPEDFAPKLEVVEDEQPRSPRPRPEHKRVWASLEKPTEQVIADAFEEAHTRDPEGKKCWVVLVDGHTQQLRLLRKVIDRLGLNVTIIVDFVHVLEYLWRASYAFHPEGSTEAQVWVQERMLRVLQGKAVEVAAGIKQSATKRKLSKTRRKHADRCANYLLNNKALIAYDTYLREGFPIATGVIEGACRHLICDRLDITGARWSLPGAEAILKLRAIYSSGDFDQYWAFHEAQEYKRNHLDHYADGRVPSLKPLKTRTILRLVK